nr:MAG TPA: hypothetical protein [Caudoviricetes sp.]
MDALELPQTAQATAKSTAMKAGNSINRERVGMGVVTIVFDNSL